MKYFIFIPFYMLILATLYKTYFKYLMKNNYKIFCKYLFTEYFIYFY